MTNELQSMVHRSETMARKLAHIGLAAEYTSTGEIAPDGKLVTYHGVDEAESIILNALKHVEVETELRLARDVMSKLVEMFKDAPKAFDYDNVKVTAYRDAIHEFSMWLPNALVDELRSGDASEREAAEKVLRGEL